MDYQEAKDLILHEGTPVNGIHICVRMGDDPGHERMMRIVEAIDSMIANEDLGASIERKMAYSLFVIAHETEVQSTSWQEENQWRDGGFFEDLTVLQENVFEYLEVSLKIDETD